jgi:2-desacetyl-2-hydroxyethyl bacteriochlorophyllide A dehydrogenase
MESQYVVFPAKDQVEVKTEEVSADDLGPMEVIIRTETSVISAGTELARLGDLEADHSFPDRPGYAAVGRIEKVGPAVDDFQVGDRVFFAGKHASVQRFEHGQNHQWGRCYAVPEDVPAEDAPYVCLAGIAGVAPWIAPCDLGDTVAVFGLGVIGNFCAQLYQWMGARVIALDPVAQRCELARKVGLTHVVDAAPDKQLDAIAEIVGETGVDIAVDAAGHSAVVRNAVFATRKYGSAVLLGTPRAPLEGNLTEVFNRVHMLAVRMIGAHMWQFPAMEMHEVKKTVARQYEMLFELIEAGALRVGPLRSHVITAEKAPEAYAGLRDQRDQWWGVVIDWR